MNALEIGDVPASFETPPGLARAQFHAMGTSVSLLLPQAQRDAGAAAVRALFAEWEQRLSRFLPESELSYVNQHAGEVVRVSELFISVLTTALDAAYATEGLYDPTLLRQVIAVGYDRSFEHVPAPLPAMLPPYGLHPGGDWRAIQVDRAQRTVMLPGGAGLDFGGIAKGMAVDAAIEHLRSLDILPAMVNAGGDLAVVGVPLGAADWPIAIEGRDRDTPWILPLRHGALATSGVARRRWRQGAEIRHHLLDPRTGEPAANGLWSVSVAAARCEQAEVAAKAAFILGPEQRDTFLCAHALAGLFQYEDGRWQVVGAWPESAEADTVGSGR